MEQIIVRRSGIHRPECIIAPDEWTFDETATEVWYWLLAETRRKEFKRQRDKFTCEAKIEVLANILANVLGMAGAYWVLQAREIAPKRVHNDRTT